MGAGSGWSGVHLYSCGLRNSPIIRLQCDSLMECTSFMEALSL